MLHYEFSKSIMSFPSLLQNELLELKLDVTFYDFPEQSFKFLLKSVHI